MHPHQHDSHVRLAQSLHLARITRVGLLVSRCCACLGIYAVREVEPRFAGVTDGIHETVECITQAFGVSEARAARYLAGKAA